MTQANFMDQFRRDVVLPTDSHVSEPGEVHRLAGQNERILARLRSGPCTNVELAKLSLKYTSRVSDLRAAGFTIVAERKSRGLTVYSLKG